MGLDSMIELSSLSTTETAAMPRRNETALGVVLAIAVAVACLVLSLRGVHLGDVWAALKHVRIGPLAAAFLVFSFASFARSLRWRTLLSAEERFFGAVNLLGDNGGISWE